MKERTIKINLMVWIIAALAFGVVQPCTQVKASETRVLLGSVYSYHIHDGSATSGGGCRRKPKLCGGRMVTRTENPHGCGVSAVSPGCAACGCKYEPPSPGRPSGNASCNCPKPTVTSCERCGRQGGGGSCSAISGYEVNCGISTSNKEFTLNLYTDTIEASNQPIHLMLDIVEVNGVTINSINWSTGVTENNIVIDKNALYKASVVYTISNGRQFTKEIQTTIKNIDTQKPVMTKIGYYRNGVITTTPSVDYVIEEMVGIEVKDIGDALGMAGLETTCISFDKGTTWESLTDATKGLKVVTVRKNGPITFWLRDKAGNTANINSAEDGFTFEVEKIDNIPPTITIKPDNNIYVKERTIEFDVEEEQSALALKGIIIIKGSFDEKTFRPKESDWIGPGTTAVGSFPFLVSYSNADRSAHIQSTITGKNANDDYTVVARDLCDNIAIQTLHVKNIDAQPPKVESTRELEYKGKWEASKEVEFQIKEYETTFMKHGFYVVRGNVSNPESYVVKEADWVSPGEHKLSNGLIYKIQTRNNEKDAILSLLTKNTEECGVYTVFYRDMCNNQSFSIYEIQKVDSIAPIFKTVALETTDWVKQTTLKIEAYDKEAGIDIATFSVDGGKTFMSAEKTSSKEIDSFVYAAKQTVEENGEYEVLVKDLAGNIAKEKAVVTNIDNKEPKIITKVSTTSPTNNNVLITVAGEDDISGIAQMGYSFDGGTTWGNETVYQAQENGVYEICVKDKAGNIGYTTENIENIDREGTIDVEIVSNANKWTAENIVLSLKMSDDTIVNLANQPYSWDGGTTWVSRDKLVVSENGLYTVKVRDVYGNEKSANHRVSYIDKTPPYVTYKIQNEGKVEIVATDSQSGLSILPYSWDEGKSWTKEAVRKIPETKQQMIWVKDVVGNIYKKGISYINGKFEEFVLPEITTQNESMEVSFSKAKSRSDPLNDSGLRSQTVFWAELISPLKKALPFVMISFLALFWLLLLLLKRDKDQKDDAE